MLASKGGGVTLLAEGVNLARAFTEECCLGHFCCVWMCVGVGVGVCMCVCVSVSDQSLRRFLLPQICRAWYSDLCLLLAKHIYDQIKHFYRSTICTATLMVPGRCRCIMSLQHKMDGCWLACSHTVNVIKMMAYFI